MLKSLNRRIVKCSNAIAAAALFVLAVLANSCSIETSGNGDLDGFWRLTSVDTLSTGGSCDLSKSCLFWAVQGNLLELQAPPLYEEENNGIIYTLDYDGDMLHLAHPRFLKRLKGDPALREEHLCFLNPFGVSSLEEFFHIRHLSGSRMTLESKALQLHFEKF